MLNRSRSFLGAMLLSAALAGCAAPSATPGHPSGPVPAFASRPYAPFNRADAVAIALREWRLFGQPVDDDPPAARPNLQPQDKPERMPGLWQRVGEYWWIGLDARWPEGYWTGKHDENGNVFPARQDGNYAWSAAFISYVMRIAGAGPRFPYSEAHHTYINIASQMSMRQTLGWAVVAEPTDTYAPQAGDLICFGRGAARGMRYEDLPTSDAFTAHCAIVVALGEELSVIGGNVDDSVTLTHVPTTTDGRLSINGGIPIDQRYPWFVVLRVLYDDMPTAP